MCSISISDTFNDKVISERIPPKRIRWKDESGDELTTIILIVQTDEERLEERKAKDWRKTYRYASKFSNYGLDGLGGDWYRFQEKVNQLDEPDWCCIGQLWARHYGKSQRFEETSFEEVCRYEVPALFVAEDDEDVLMSSIIKTDFDSEDSVQNITFEDLDSISSLEAFLDSQDDSSSSHNTDTFSSDCNFRDLDS